MKPLTFRASSAIKTIRRARQHIQEGDIVAACTIKRLELELRDDVWQKLELVSSWDPDDSIAGTIEMIVNASRLLEELAGRRKARAAGVRYNTPPPEPISFEQLRDGWSLRFSPPAPPAPAAAAVPQTQGGAK